MEKNKYQVPILLLLPLLITFVLSSAYATELTIYIWEDYVADKAFPFFGRQEIC